MMGVATSDFYSWFLQFPLPLHHQDLLRQRPILFHCLDILVSLLNSFSYNLVDKSKVSSVAQLIRFTLTDHSAITLSPLLAHLLRISICNFHLSLYLPFLFTHHERKSWSPIHVGAPSPTSAGTQPTFKGRSGETKSTCQRGQH